MGGGCHPIIFGFGCGFEMPNTERLVEASEPEWTPPASILQLSEVARIKILAKCEDWIAREIVGELASGG